MHPSGKIISNIDDMSTSFTMANGFYAQFKVDPRNLTANDMFSYDIFTNHDIIISDSARSTYYVHSAGTLTGDSISPEQHTTMLYSRSFEEVHWLEQSGEFAFHSRLMPTVLPRSMRTWSNPFSGVMFPWLSAPSEPANCKGRIYLENKTQFNTNIDMIMLKALRTGLETTDCLKPCIEVLAQSRLVRKKIVKRNLDIQEEGQGNKVSAGLRTL